MVNRSDATAVYLEVGSRSPDDLTTCSDVDMMSSNTDGRFLLKDGTPYPGQRATICAGSGGPRQPPPPRVRVSSSTRLQRTIAQDRYPLGRYRPAT